jgi:glycosyltransferase involved in cell wall biosynthesis
MKALLLSTYDINGGAGRATYRLHQGLRTIGVDSQMMVQEKTSDEATILGSTVSLMQGVARSKITLDTLPLKLLYPQWDRSNPFSLQWLPDRLLPKINRIQPDIINLHWIGSSFVQIPTLAKLKQPIVWTLHDMWAFTGGCHYSGDCDRYTQSCGQCPSLGSHQKLDASRWIWRKKHQNWQHLNVTLVSPSRWLADCARSSALFKNTPIEHIPNGINTEHYQPIDSAFARKLLHLPADKKLILFGAIRATSEKRKGFHLLQAALQDLRRSGLGDDWEVVILGASPPLVPIEMGFQVHYLGTLKDDLSLALVYSAADVFVLPSTQDNLPNVVVEAMSCGTPSVAFKIGGVPDMIDHQQNGYLANPSDTHDLAQGIAWVLAFPERLQELSQRAREKVEQEFTLNLQARRYEELFRQLITSNSGGKTWQQNH